MAYARVSLSSTSSISRPEKCLETLIVERLKVFLRDLWQQIELAIGDATPRLVALLLVVTEAE
jgi:hypothetical protein